MKDVDKESAALDARLDAMERHEKDQLKAKLEAPLVERIRASGRDVESVWDLAIYPDDHVDLLDVLFEHMEKPYPRGTRHSIARAVDMRESSAYWDILMERYMHEVDNRVRDGLACSISSACSVSRIVEVLELLRDETRGDSRLLLVEGLKRFRTRPEIRGLDEFRDHPTLGETVRRVRGVSIGG